MVVGDVSDVDQDEEDEGDEEEEGSEDSKGFSTFRCSFDFCVCKFGIGVCGCGRYLGGRSIRAL